MAKMSRRRQNDVSIGRNAGRSDGVVAGLKGSGGLGVALPCASAKRSRLLPGVFDDCSHVAGRVSLLGRAIIREVNETVVCSKFLGDRRSCW